MLVMVVLLVLSTYKYKYVNFVVDKEIAPTTTTTAATAVATAATNISKLFKESIENPCKYTNFIVGKENVGKSITTVTLLPPL